MNEYVKSHGLGNDYIVLDEEKLSFSLNPEIIKLICHRNYGIGSDGILLLTKSNNSDFGLRILNPDGSEAEKSGNGLRIFAKFLFNHNYTQKNIFSIETLGGIVSAEIDSSDKSVRLVTVEMGTATFDSNQIPVSGDKREVVDEEIQINGNIFNYSAVSIGNPHCVVFMEELDKQILLKIGPLLENHENFPNRTNVQFAKVINENLVEILIWERGAGYTLASGSSACAVASVAVKKNLTSNFLTISMPGGNLDIEIREDWTIRMRGPVEEISSGTISVDLLEKIRELS